MKLKPRLVDHFGPLMLAVSPRKNSGAEGSLKSGDQPPILVSTVGHTESIEHLRGA
jgi:hypothetical protein